VQLLISPRSLSLIFYTKLHEFWQEVNRRVIARDRRHRRDRKAKPNLPTSRCIIGGHEWS
jgi:hypothetical protein